MNNPPKRAILGIPKFKPTALEVLMFGSNLSDLEKKQISGMNRNYQEIVPFDNQHILALSKDGAGKSHLTVQDFETSREFEVPAELNLNVPPFADPEENKVYCWDWKTRKLFSWDKSGKLLGSVDMEGPPLSYAKHQGRLLVGCTDGRIFFNGAEVAKLGNDKIKKMLVNGNDLVVIAVGVSDGSYFPLTSNVFSMDSFKPKQDSEFGGQSLIDAVEHDGIIYTAGKSWITQHRGDGKSNQKFIDVPEGIESLFPARTEKDNVIFYLTRRGTLAHTRIDDFNKHPAGKYPAKKEKMSKAGDNVYRPIVIL